MAVQLATRKQYSLEFLRELVIRSGVPVSASFHKIPQLMGRLWSGSRVVGRLVSEVYGLMPVYKKSSRGSRRLVRVRTPRCGSVIESGV